MTNVFTCLMKKKFGNGNGSGMDRESIGNGSARMGLHNRALAAKTSRKLFAVLFCLLFVGVGQMWGKDGDTAYTLTCTQNSSNTAYANTFDVVISSKTWNAPGNQNAGSGWRVGGAKGTGVSRYITGKSTIDSPIKKITVNHNGVSNANLTINSFSVTVSKNSDFSAPIETKTVTSPSVGSAGSFDLTPTSSPWPSGCYYKFTLVYTHNKSSNYGLDLTSLVFVEGSAGTSYTLTFKEWDGGGTASGSPSTGSVTANATSFSFGATAPSKTGHTIEGFYTNTSASSGVKVANSSRQFVASVTDWTNGSSQYTKGANANLYIKWTPKVCAITLDKGTSGTTDGSVSYTYGNSTKTGAITHATKTGYHLNGYYTAASSGTKILNADGTLAGDNISVSTTTFTSGGNWAYDGTSLTLYAQWTIDNYTVHWKVNGEDWEGVSHGSPSTDANYNTKPATIPTAPVSNDCDGSKVFVGWTNSTYSHASTAPTILFSSQSSAPAITGNTTFHAVFATAGAGGSSNIQLSYTSLSLTTSYESGSTKSVSDVDFYCNDIMTGTSGSDGYQKIQFKKSSTGPGYIYNSEILPGNITSIVFGSTTRDMTVNFGDSSDPDGSTETTTCSSSSLTATPTGNYKYFKILNSVDNAAYTGTITINYSSISYSNYETNCCTPLGSINGSISWTHPNEAVVSWDNLANVSSWTLKYKEHGAGAWTTAFTNKTGSDSEITVYSDGGTDNKMKSTIATTCNTAYDFLIIANPASGYCDKEEELNNSGSGYNSGMWDLDYTFSGAALKDGDLDEGTGVLCGDLVITIEPLSVAYELPSDVIVTIGGDTKTIDTDYLWDPETGELVIYDSEIDGNVAIEIEGVLVGCSAVPEIGAASLNGAFGLSSVGVTVGTSSTGSAYCAWTDYGFVWSESANPTVGGSGCTKVVVGSDGSATTWNGSLTKTSFATGTTYYFRAYGKNSKDDAAFVYSSSDGTFTPRSVTFNSNGGSSVDTKYVNSGGSVSAPSAPTKTGYTFDSWRTTSGLTTAMDFSGTITKDTTVYAKWTANTYTVTISKNYGAAATKDYTATYDADMPSLSDFTITRGGYKLAGIFDDPDDGEGKKYYNADKTSAATWDKTANTTLYAHWSANSYTITLTNEGADEGHEGTESISVTYDSNENLTSAIDKPEKDGYKFCGYFTDVDGGGTQLIDEDGNIIASVSNYTSATKQWKKASDVELHAYWKEVYTVTWKVDGEEWSSGVVTGNTSVVDGEKVSALPTAPTKSDCDDSKTFIGWRASTISGSTDDKPDGLFNTQAGSPAITDDVTFHAVFANVTGGVAIELTYPLDNKSTCGVGDYTSTWTATKGDYSWSISNFNNNNWDTGWTSDIRCGRKSYTSVASITTVAALGIRVDSVYINLTATKSDNVNSAKLQISSASTFATKTEMDIPVSSTGVKGLKIASPATDKYYRVVFDLKDDGGTSNGFIRVGSIVYKQKLDTAGYVTTCAECTAPPTFSAAPAVSDIGCEGATVTASISSLGTGDGCHIREYGFVWGTGSKTTPTLESNDGKYSVADEIDADEDFNYDTTGLTIGTHYYVRAYAKNKSGVAYSTVANFWTQGVSSIAITESPRTKYIAGETFDPSGMEVTATMASGSTEVVTASCEYSDDALTAGTSQAFDITYTLCDEVEATLTIDVYTLTVTEGTNPSYGSFSSSANVITVSPTSGNIGVPVVTSENAEIVDNNDNTYTIVNPTGNVAVTINYRAAVATVVHYYVNGVEITGLKATPTEGTSFDLPNASAVATAIASQGVSIPDATNYSNFWGWSRTSVHAQSTDPTVLNGSTKVYTETSFYAVYTNMSKIRIDESDITYTSYKDGYSSGALSSTFGGKDFTYYNILKVNTTKLQFKKDASDYGYIFNTGAISYIKHVNIGASGDNDNIKVFACSDNEGTISGSALSDADTRDDAYVYNMPSNTQYFIVKGDNSFTYKIDYIDIYYSSGSAEELYMSTFESTFEPAGTSGNWSDKSNWADGQLPTIKDDVTIKKPVTVDITTARAKSIVLDQNSKTGKLVISAGKALAVAETIKKTTDGSSKIATAENDIVIESNSSNGTGALVVGQESHNTKATVQFYSVARKNASDKYVNQYIGIPVDSVSKLAYYGSYLRKFDVSTDAWVSFGKGEEKMYGFNAYRIMRAEQDGGGTYEIGGDLVLPGTTTHKDTILTLTKTATTPTDNMFANSWTAPIDVTKFDASDFTGALATIYVFNAGSSDDGDNSSAYTRSPGNWNAMPVEAVKAAVAANPSQTTYDLTQIPSQQAFLVQTDGTGGTYKLKLDYKKLVYDPIATNGATIIPTRAPKRTKEAEVDEEVELMQLNLKAESGLGDRVLMYISDDFSTEELDNGWEAYKLPGQPFAPQFCANTPLGEMAISATNEIEGTVLGFYAGTEDDHYTFSFEYNGEDLWYLNDLDTKASTPIRNERTYQFTAVRGTATETRFTISKSPIAEMPSGVGNAESAVEIRKLLIHGNLYIIRAGRMYNAEGALVK